MYKNKKRLEINSLLENLNVLTISERADWTRAKNVLKFSTSEVEDLAKVYQFSERKVRSMPLLNVLRSNSETLRKSVKFKSISFWNSLPRNWNLDDLSMDQLKDKVFDFLVCKRRSIFVQF